MNFFQKILPFIYPLFLIEVSIMTAVLLVLLGAKRKFVLLVLGIAFLVLFISSQTALSGWYLTCLENEYPPLATREIMEKSYPVGSEKISYIVVLGAGGIFQPTYPESSQIPPSGVVRIVEGIRWWREFPQSKLLFSGGDALHGSTEAEMMKRLAEQLGVPSESIEVDLHSKSTEEQIQVISKRLKGSKFLLVTSAWKMSRAARGFQKMGSNFIPVPTDYKSKTPERGAWKISAIPWGETLGNSEVAMKEALGKLWRRFHAYDEVTR